VPKTIIGVSAPTAPSLSQPTNGATKVATTLTVSWTSASYATSYAVLVSAVSSFTSTVAS
jgi:hypothetical protein